MVYKAPELGYHTTLLTIPHSYKKKKKKNATKNNWTKTYTCTIASIWESLYDK